MLRNAIAGISLVEGTEPPTLTAGGGRPKEAIVDRPAGSPKPCVRSEALRPRRKNRPPPRAAPLASVCPPGRSVPMKAITIATAAALTAAAILCGATLSAAPARAAGCVKGAVVGGVAGHYLAHHGWLGAAAGCAIGRHEANKRA